MMSGLIWNPTSAAIERHINEGDELILIFSPFAKVDALDRLLAGSRGKKGLKIVCRWRPADLLTGVSDLALFPFAMERGWELYLNDFIHLKLFIFSSNAAFTSSGNLTLRGLGYGEPSNIETGMMLQLDSTDWIKIYEVIQSSRRVDEKLYRALYDYVQSSPPQSSLPSALTIFPSVSKQFTIASLPATETPQRLADYYFGPDRSSFSPEDVRRVAHDLSVFRIPEGLQQDGFHGALRQAFITVPFVVEFVEFLKFHGSLRFGAVNNWIHEKCEDVPLPYKWEIKTNTRIFYNWLTNFFREIDWNIPGEHSQVIYWRDADEPVDVGFSDSSSTLGYYQKLLSSLGNREKAIEWNAVSIGGAPHQPLLLLAVTKLYERNSDRPNLIMLNKELQDLFSPCFSVVVGLNHPTSVAMPFVALGKEPFWHLIKREKTGEVAGQIRSQAAFDQAYQGATLDDDLHHLLASSGARIALQNTILRSYFPEKVRLTLSETLSSE
jgi:hypothetical protein